MPGEDEQRAELVRLISVGLQAGPEVVKDGSAAFHAEVLLESFVKSRLDTLAGEVVYRAFSNTSIKQILDDLHESTNDNFKTLQKNVEDLSGLRLQVTTGIITAVIITAMIYFLKKSGLPIDIFSKP